MLSVEGMSPAMWADQPRSKILATVGPAQQSYDDMYNLVAAGADGVRLNMSHMGYRGPHEQANFDAPMQYIQWARRAQRDLDVNLAVVLDLQGPKNRFGSIGEPREVAADDEITLRYGEDASADEFLTQIDLSQSVAPGSEILFCDANITGNVVAVEGPNVHVRVLNPGVIESNKSINTPGTPIADVFPTKDRKDLEWGASTGEIDWVAQSFVQTPADAMLLEQAMLENRMDAMRMLKAETASAVDDANLYELLKHYHEIWVARGDLASETAFYRVPEIQRKIVNACHAAGVSVRICTQLMLSMADGSLRPTRAEGTDVNLAAHSRAGVMFSEETARRGGNPPHTVRVARQFIMAAETDLAPIERHLAAYEGHATNVGAVALGISEMAERIDSPIIVAQTKSGRTAMEVAALTDRPVVAVTSEKRTAQQLALIRGVIPVTRRVQLNGGQSFVRQQRRKGHLEASRSVVVASGLKAGQQGGTSRIDIV